MVLESLPAEKLLSALEREHWTGRKGHSARLRELLSGFGSKLAADSTDFVAYANGHRQNPADPDACWSAKGKGHQSKGSLGKGSESSGKKGKKRELYW